VRDVAAVFLKLGVIGFGGPAAHIGMMEEEVVTKRKWIDREHFLDLVGLTNLIPGPNSTEMAIHLGYLRAGWKGLIIGGACFIAPAVVLTSLLAWVYVTYGELYAVRSFTEGIRPAVLAVILAAGWRLARTAVQAPVHGVLFALVAAGALLGLGELTSLFAGTALGTLVLARRDRNVARAAGGLLLAAVSLPKLFGVFLKTGAVLYGSGYVLVAFLEGDLVEKYGWLTQGELLDAIAIGQFTPGPVLSTSTFIGYQVAGARGAVLATLGIFAPSFVFVAALGPIAARLRKSSWAQPFLAAVRVAAVALLAAVLVRLGRATLVDVPAAAMAVAAAVAAIGFRVGALWIVIGGGILGLLL